MTDRHINKTYRKLLKDNTDKIANVKMRMQEERKNSSLLFA